MLLLLGLSSSLAELSSGWSFSYSSSVSTSLYPESLFPAFPLLLSCLTGVSSVAKISTLGFVFCSALLLSGAPAGLTGMSAFSSSMAAVTSTCALENTPASPFFFTFLTFIMTAPAPSSERAAFNASSSVFAVNFLIIILSSSYHAYALQLHVIFYLII